VIARGPIETLDARTGAFTVLGQTFQATASLDSIGEIATILESGAIVTATVSGTLGRGAPKATAVSFSVEAYVPGVTPVFLIGKIDRVDAETAFLTIRGLRIDQSPLLSSEPARVQSGDLVLAIGSITSTGAALVPMHITRM
jgi:hypothetical protein